MLIGLEIKNFAIIGDLKIELSSGLTCITGETGAGKSLILDSLELVLARRKARVGELRSQCELVAVFDLINLSEARSWLEDRGMLDKDDSVRAIVRRYWHSDRVYNSINGHTCTQGNIRELGWLLLQIYGQHQYYQLTDIKQHLRWLDSFAGHEQQLQQVHACYLEWQGLQTQKTCLLERQQSSLAEMDFLDFKLQELSSVNISKEYISELQQRQRTGAYHEQLMQILGDVDQLLGGERGLVDQLAKIKSELCKWHHEPNVCADVLELLDLASIQIDEAAQRISGSLRDESQQDWEIYKRTEDELAEIYGLARKYRVDPEQLMEYRSRLEREKLELEQLQQSISELDRKIVDARKRYDVLAALLSKSRAKHARLLDVQVNRYLRRLGMKQAVFTTKLLDIDADNNDNPGSWGVEKAEFYLTVNAGSDPQPLRLVASGGELSRVNLVLQTVIGFRVSLPTMIFDEVDSGIGGVAAESVAELLHELGRSAQVVCVTHLAQIAARGDWHFCVSKQQGVNSTSVFVRLLSQEERVSEIARMLSGSKLTELTIAHASELLDSKYTSS